MDATWTCATCRVVASFAEPSALVLPVGWAKVEDGWSCLACRRQEVINAAAPANAVGAAGSRRRALIEFELMREPSAANHEIAKRAKCATFTVRPIRAALQADGRLAATD
jgi:hypothetical protein